MLRGIHFWSGCFLFHLYYTQCNGKVQVAYWNFSSFTNKLPLARNTWNIGAVKQLFRLYHLLIAIHFPFDNPQLYSTLPVILSPNPLTPPGPMIKHFLFSGIFTPKSPGNHAPTPHFGTQKRPHMVSHTRSLSQILFFRFE